MLGYESLYQNCDQEISNEEIKLREIQFRKGIKRNFIEEEMVNKYILKCFVLIFGFIINRENYKELRIEIVYY